MIQSDSVFKQGWDNQYNFFLYFLFVNFIAGSLFLTLNKIDGGFTYTMLVVVALVSVTFLKVFVKDEEGVNSELSRIVRFPFFGHQGVSIFMFLVGLVGVFFLSILGKVLSFNITSFSIPLFANKFGVAVQTFTAANISGSLAWRLFVTSFSAGVGETLVFSWAAIIVNIGIVLFIWHLFKGYSKTETTLLGVPKRHFVLVLSLILTGLEFIGLHVLNNTYTGANFWIAFVFIMFSNISIYYFGWALTFWIGYHIGNNMLFIIREVGFETFVKDGLFSWYGVFLAVLLVVLIGHLIFYWKDIRPVLSVYLRKILSFGLA